MQEVHSKMVVSIQLSNIADGKINVPQRVTAKISSTLGIKNIEWLCNKKVNFSISTDQKTYSFTPSATGEYVFSVTVWETDGNRASATSTVNVPESQQPTPQPVPQPSPQPAGVLWSSKGIWDNGKERTMTGHHEYDPYDKLTEIAAGENRKWFIDGKGNSFVSGARARVYNHTKQVAGKRYVYEISYIHNSSLDNLSFQLFSRHNEDDPEENRTGGPTYAFHNGNIEFDHEYWHNERDSKLADTHNLINKIVNGQVTKLKLIGLKTVSGDQVSYKTEIFINDKPEWIHSFNSNHDKASIKEALYWRFRTNGDAPKDVKILSASISVL